MYICIYVYMYICIYVYMYTCIYVYMYMYIHVYAFVYLCICMYLCVCKYVYASVDLSISMRQTKVDLTGMRMAVSDDKIKYVWSYNFDH